jgi:hypothetical protein
MQEDRLRKKQGAELTHSAGALHGDPFCYAKRVKKYSPSLCSREA